MLVASLLLVVHPRSREVRATPPDTSSPAGPSAPPGLQLPFVFDGRPFELTQPASRPTRLVIALHQLYGNAEDFQQLAGLDGLAAQQGWVVVYPSGLHGSWNAGGCCGWAQRHGVDDVQYVLSLAAWLRQRLGFTDQPTDLMGWSNGGMLALAVMCRAPDRVGAVVGVSANLQQRTCGGARPLLLIRGGTDRTVPIHGGYSETAKADLFPDLLGVSAIAQAARCKPVLSVRSSNDVTRTTAACDGRPLITEIVAERSGHAYPSRQNGDALTAAVEVSKFFESVG